jgi:hypothetical protein
MPFKNARQLKVCYSKKISADSKGSRSGWNCDAWLKETMKPWCLPETSHSQPKCRDAHKRDRLNKSSKLYEGARGGLYYYVAGIKVYVPKDAQAHLRKTKKVYKEKHVHWK